MQQMSEGKLYLMISNILQSHARASLEKKPLFLSTSPVMFSVGALISTHICHWCTMSARSCTQVDKENFLNPISIWLQCHLLDNFSLLPDLWNSWTCNQKFQHCLLMHGSRLTERIENCQLCIDIQALTFLCINRHVCRYWYSNTIIVPILIVVNKKYRIANEGSVAAK